MDLLCAGFGGRPRFWVTAWAGGLGMNGLKRNSVHQALRNLDRFYTYCESRFGDDAIDDAIGRRNPTALQNMAEMFYLHLAAHGEYNTGDAQCWSSTVKFLRFFCKRFAADDERWFAFDAYLAAVRKLHPPESGKFRFVRALPDVTLRELVTVSHFEAVANPFQSQSTRRRNWLIVNMLLLAGLRRGELLSLKVTSLQSEPESRTGRMRWWLNVTRSDDDEETDDRASRPSIKTSQSHRQVPVSWSLASLYENYVGEHRAHSHAHDFLFTSRDGLPLSAESVEKAFQAITRCLSAVALKRFEDVTGGKKFISPHDLRHTCATARWGQYMAIDGDRELSLQKMRAFFGWSRESEMPEVYARAAIQDDLLATWSDVFDERVKTLRSMA